MFGDLVAQISWRNAWRAGSAALIRIDGSGIGPVDEELIATDRVSLYETVGRAAEWELILSLSGFSGLSGLSG